MSEILADEIVDESILVVRGVKRARIGFSNVVHDAPSFLLHHVINIKYERLAAEINLDVIPRLLHTHGRVQSFTFDIGESDA